MSQKREEENLHHITEVGTIRCTALRCIRRNKSLLCYCDYTTQNTLRGQEAGDWPERLMRSFLQTVLFFLCSSFVCSKFPLQRVQHHRSFLASFSCYGDNTKLFQFVTMKYSTYHVFHQKPRLYHSCCHLSVVCFFSILTSVSDIIV